MNRNRGWIRRVVRLAIGAALIGATSVQISPARAGGGFVVSDEWDIVLHDNFLSLREALNAASGVQTCGWTEAEQANLVGCTFAAGSNCISGGCGAGYYDNIIFGPAVNRIRLYSPLVIGDEGTWIDGAKSGGGKVVIGPWPDAYAGGPVFRIEGANDTISNVATVDGDPFWPDVLVWWTAAGARVAYNDLGVLPGATICIPSGVSRLSGDGVQVRGSASHPLTDQAFIYGNVIGCHLQDAILTDGAEGVYVGYRPDKLTADGNWLGVSRTGVPLANGGHGVKIWFDSSRTSVVSNNTVTHNGQAGIAIIGTGYGAAVGNNTVFGNGGLPIDLGDNGHTPNDPGDGDSGPNHYINYPEVTTVAGSQVWGNTCPSCRVDVYQAYGDPSQPGGGGIFKASVSAETSGIWHLDLSTLPGMSNARVSDLSFVTYSPYNGSSEMSPRPNLFLPMIRKS